MKKGCLLLIAFWALTGLINYFLLDQIGRTIPWYVAVLLGLSATIVIANIHGLHLGWRRWRASQRSPQEWRDGVLVGVSGKLSALKSPIVAPGCGKPVVIYETEICQRPASSEAGEERILTSSFGMAPCGIATRQGVLRLIGFPLMTTVPQKRYDEEQELQRAAEYLAATKWTKSATAIPNALAELNAVLNDADGDVRADFCRKLELFEDFDEFEDSELEAADDPESSESEGSTESKGAGPTDDKPLQAVEYYRNLLIEHPSYIKEQVVENGAEVSVFGTYSQNPARINVGAAFTNLSHGLFLGPMGAVLKTQALKSLIAVLFWGLVCGAAHAYAYVGIEGIKRILQGS